MIGPGVEFKSVERHALHPHAFLVQPGADFGIETVLVHAEVGRRVAQADDAREQQVQEALAVGRHADSISSDPNAAQDFDRDNAARANRRRTSPQREQGEEMISW